MPSDPADPPAASCSELPTYHIVHRHRHRHNAWGAALGRLLVLAEHLFGRHRHACTYVNNGDMDLGAGLGRPQLVAWGVGSQDRFQRLYGMSISMLTRHPFGRNALLIDGSGPTLPSPMAPPAAALHRHQTARPAAAAAGSEVSCYSMTEPAQHRYAASCCRRHLRCRCRYRRHAAALLKPI